MTKDCVGYKLHDVPCCKKCVLQRLAVRLKDLVELYEEDADLVCASCGLSLGESRGDE